MSDFALELKRLLREAGCYFVRSGKDDHEIWFSPMVGPEGIPEQRSLPAPRADTGNTSVIQYQPSAICSSLEGSHRRGHKRGGHLLPEPDQLAEEIIENLEAGLNSFREVLVGLVRTS
jgi:hypothetical protein